MKKRPCRVSFFMIFLIHYSYQERVLKGYLIKMEYPLLSENITCPLEVSNEQQ